MTRKGQVTIPAEIREELNIKEGDVLSVKVVDHTVVFESAREAFLSALEAIRQHARDVPPLTPEEMDEVVAGAMVEEYLESIADR
jgi:AbrB family looped-hinge helix DNA binding protein